MLACLLAYLPVCLSACLKAPRDLGDIYLVFDFVDTDLQKIFKSDQYMSTGHVKYIMYQLLLGMKFMHSANVIHRDIKPANILISCSDCRLKIADFGLARVISSDEMWKRRQPVLPRTESKKKETNTSALGSAISSIFSLASTGAEKRPSSASLGPGMPPAEELLGPGSGLGPPDGSESGARPALRRQLTHHVITRWYRAPEVILSQPYDALVDMWSIGCIFAELLGMIKENIPNYKQRRPIFPGERYYHYHILVIYSL